MHRHLNHNLSSGNQKILLRSEHTNATLFWLRHAGLNKLGVPKAFK